MRAAYTQTGILWTDSMVLASVEVVGSGGPCKIPTVRDRHVQSATARLCVPRRYERHPEVPDPPRRSFNGQTAVSTHMVDFVAYQLQMCHELLF